MKEIPFRTYSGRKLDLKNPNIERIEVVDIAHHLSRICRYTGAVPKHYSVAQHCIHVSKWLEDQGYNKELQLKGLLHDAAEYCLGDLHGPLKKYLAPENLYADLERAWEIAIGDKFEVKLYPMHETVHIADQVLLKREKLDLLRETTVWPSLIDIPDWNVEIHPQTSEWAREKYLERLFQLWRM